MGLRLLSPHSTVFTYVSESHGTVSAIDHILCPQYFLESFVSSSESVRTIIIIYLIIYLYWHLSMSLLLPVPHFTIIEKFHPPLTFQIGGSYWRDRIPALGMEYSNMVCQSVPKVPSHWSPSIIDSFVEDVT